MLKLNRQVSFKIIPIPIILLFGLMFISPKGFFVQNQITTQFLPDSTSTITFIAVGDLMCHSVQYDYARVEKDSFDFRPFFQFVKPILSSGDFCMGNLETVLAGKTEKYSGYPFFNTPDEYVAALKDAGFNILTTSNNHCLDRGVHGVLRTIKILQQNGIAYAGTCTSQKDKDSIRIFEKNGISFALLAYTYNTNGNPIPKGKDFLVHLIDTAKIISDISIARGKVDVVIVYFHFGEEYQRMPNTFQKYVVQATERAGADIIIGGHPHVAQPVEFFPAYHTNTDTGLVAYSMGNFFSNQRWRYSDGGVILKIGITKNAVTKKIKLSQVTYQPTWVFKGEQNKKNVYYILPETDHLTDSTYSFLRFFEKDNMLQSFSDTKSIITQFVPNLKKSFK